MNIDEQRTPPVPLPSSGSRGSLETRTMDGIDDHVLTVRDLSVEIRRGGRVVRPVSGVSLTLSRGETLGIVGETGSGKSMTGLALMGMLPAGGRITGGSIDFGGTELVG